MKIKVIYSPILKIENIRNGGDIEVVNEISVAELLRKWKLADDHQQFIQIYVNGKKERLNYILHENDVLHLILPLGGG